MRYSKEVGEFIAANVTKYPIRELVRVTNETFGTEFTYEKMRCYKTNHKLKSGLPKGTAKGSSRLFTPDIKDFIFENHKGTIPDKMAEIVNKKFGTSYTGSQISTYYKNNKLRSGISGCYPKGHVPQIKALRVFVLKAVSPVGLKKVISLPTISQSAASE